MRATSSIALLLGAVLGSPAHAKLVVTADVMRSEWTPPMQLTLDLDSWRYVIALPKEPWPESRPKPKPRSGTLGATELKEVRAAVQAAIADGLADKACLTTPPKERQWIVISNGGPNRIVIDAGNATLIAPSELECRTPAAERLYNRLEETFDGRRKPNR